MKKVALTYLRTLYDAYCSFALQSRTVTDVSN